MPGADDGSSTGVEKQKKRTPAWCDRVLWRPGAKLHQLAYGRAEIAVGAERHSDTSQTWQAYGICAKCLW